jgi:hypothetical protein
MSIEVLKSELLKLGRAELLDILQYGLEVMKSKDQEDFETPEWLKEEILKRAVEMKSGKAQTFSWEDVKNYAKSSNA